MHGIQTWGLSFVGADGSTELCFGPPQNSFQFQLTTRSSFLFVFLLSSTNFTRKNCLLKQDSNSSRRSRRREWWPLDHHVGHPNNDIFIRKRKWWQKNDSKMTETIEIEWFYLKRRLLDQTLFSLSPIRLNGHLSPQNFPIFIFSLVLKKGIQNIAYFTTIFVQLFIA